MRNPLGFYMSAAKILATLPHNPPQNSAALKAAERRRTGFSVGTQPFFFF
jgi:hypothetical protein